VINRQGGVRGEGRVRFAWTCLAGFGRSEMGPTTSELQVDLPGRSARSKSLTRLGVRRQSPRRRLFRGLFLLAFGVGAVMLGAASMMGAFWLQLGSPFHGVGLATSFRPYFPVAVFAALLRGAIFLRGRPHRKRRNRGYADELFDGVRQAAAGTVGVIVFTFLWRGGTRYHAFSYARSIFILDLLLSSVALVDFLVFTKMVLEHLRHRGFNRRSVVVVGSARTAAAFSADLAAHPEIGYEVVASIVWNDASDAIAQLRRIALEAWIDEVILASSTIDRRDISMLVSCPELRYVQLRAIPELFGLPPTKVTLAVTGEFPLLSLMNEPFSASRRALKRSLDLVIGGFVAVVSLPLTALAWVTIRLTSPGPAFFYQDRVGLDGRPFRIVKFRTMRVGSESEEHERYVVDLIAGKIDSTETGGLFKLVDDPRVTSVGRVLRRLSIDELPQLLNVFRGEMSLVGPRPAIPYEVEAYREWHRRRLDVRPGMTGLWQVSGRNRLGFDDMVRLDISYIETWSPLSDFSIMLRTLPALVRDRGA